MKIKFTLVLFALVLFTMSCEDDLTVNIDTNFVTDIVAESVEEPIVGIATKSASMCKFQGNNSIALKDADDVKAYIDRIKSIKITGVECEITGITSGEKIESLTIAIDSTSFNQQFLDISADNSSFIINVDDAILSNVETYFNKSQMLKIKVSGTTTKAPMSLNVRVRFITKVKAGIL